MVSSRRDAVKPRKKERHPIALTPLGAGEMGLRSLKGRQWLFSDFSSGSLIRQTTAGYFGGIKQKVNTLERYF